jgi:type I restriction-modification system DNA methylase subunit
MAIRKSDLYSSLWASCDELRGGMDASQYKDYVLFNSATGMCQACWNNYSEELGQAG